MSPRRTLQQDKLSTACLFERFHHILRRRVRGVVNTSDASIEDACMHAWTKVLGYEFEHVDIAQRWLTAVAIREAIKLDRRSRRTAPFGVDEHGDTIEPADPRGELWLTRLLTDVGELMKTAGLSPRQRRILVLQLLGLSYDEIAAQTGDTPRTIERQLMRARGKLAQELRENRG
jgi:RNA polymerase sigma factor (sigma-70 family)